MVTQSSCTGSSIYSNNQSVPPGTITAFRLQLDNLAMSKNSLFLAGINELNKAKNISLLKNDTLATVSESMNQLLLLSTDKTYPLSLCQIELLATTLLSLHKAMAQWIASTPTTGNCPLPFESLGVQDMSKFQALLSTERELLNSLLPKLTHYLPQSVPTFITLHQLFAANLVASFESSPNTRDCMINGNFLARQWYLGEYDKTKRAIEATLLSARKTLRDFPQPSQEIDSARHWLGLIERSWIHYLQIKTSMDTPSLFRIPDTKEIISRNKQTLKVLNPSESYTNAYTLWLDSCLKDPKNVCLSANNTGFLFESIYN